MDISCCPKCHITNITKSGVVNGRQRFLCKQCNYNFTVNKLGNKIDNYYVTKALQLYLEGISYREIERILGISHVTVSNWVKEYRIKRLIKSGYHPTYKVVSHAELLKYIKNKNALAGGGIIITELVDKYILIKWERLKG